MSLIFYDAQVYGLGYMSIAHYMMPLIWLHQTHNIKPYMLFSYRLKITSY
jgi:hypothetical protein